MPNHYNSKKANAPKNKPKSKPTMKKGSKEMRDKMARLRAMKKK
tara:strand:- start:48 stop:179 length:132 start_codon:yes stop_codon:yes gene_type:complete